MIRLSELNAVYIINKKCFNLEYLEYDFVFVNVTFLTEKLQ